MRAGLLRYALTLQSRRADDTSVSGAPQRAYADEGTIRGAVRPLGATERVEAGRQYGEVSHMVTVRGRYLDPTPAKRWRWHDPRVGRTRYLEIVGVMDWDERGKEIRCMCREAQ